MAHGMARCVETFKFHRFADLDDIAGADTDVHVGDPLAGVPVRNDLRAGRLDDAFVTANVVTVLVGVENLRNGPATIFSNGQALVEIERVDRQRVTGLRAGN